MKSINMTRNKSQIYSIGNYLMTGKVFGKGHFARVEEATHRLVSKKVAIKIIDLTLIKEEYARRNLHREPRVMARLRHPCIAALYETMMHGPRLYVVMEAASGGDLCAYVLTARGGARGLPEARARCLAVQLVSAVRHMHDRGVVHRDLKMENIMLDATKQFIKIVDFGLSNLWSSGGALRTPCGSLEYAAPELFVDGRRYGPEVDLWSIGVIVYGMVTGGLPFTAPDSSGGPGGETRDRPLLRQIITRGFGRKQRVALACVSNDCKSFIQHLLEPKVELRMKIEEAAKNRWVRKPGMRLKLHPFGNVDTRSNRELYKQIADLSGQTIEDVAAEIKSDPFGEIAGMYNIKTRHQQMHSLPATELLWSTLPQENRPNSPPEYKSHLNNKKDINSTTSQPLLTKVRSQSLVPESKSQHTYAEVAAPSNGLTNNTKTKYIPPQLRNQCKIQTVRMDWRSKNVVRQTAESKFSVSEKSIKTCRYMRSIHDGGDGYLNSRLPSIDEHSNTCVIDTKNKFSRLPKAIIKSPRVRRVNMEDGKELRLNSCPDRVSDFYRRAGDGLPSWRASATPPARILLQSNATNIKRASLGNIVSPHSSTNSHCKSERAMPVGWCSKMNKELPHLQRYRRNAPTK